MEATTDYDGLVRALETDDALVWLRDNYQRIPVYNEERYDVMYEPNFSDVSTRVPNGSFHDEEEAIEYMRDVVIDEDYE